MSRFFIRTATAVLAAVVLAGCAAELPPGPSVMAMPPPGKPMDRFQTEDNYCRSYADNASGGQQARQAATNSAVGSAALGTGLGAAAGALLGSAGGHAGTGAAIGAGSGLLLGSAIGASNAGETRAQVQHRYDMAYSQCMTSYGNQIHGGGYGYQQPSGLPLVATSPY